MNNETNKQIWKDVADGKAPLNAVVGLSETQIKAFAALGYTLYQQGRTEDAGKIFNAVVALDQNVYYGYAGLGAIALAKEPADLETAYTNLTKAVELKPDEPTTLANLGETLLRQGKFDEAAKVLEKSFKLDPNGKDPGANRARAIVGGIQMIAREAERTRQEVARVN